MTWEKRGEEAKRRVKRPEAQLRSRTGQGEGEGEDEGVELERMRLQTISNCKEGSREYRGKGDELFAVLPTEAEYTLRCRVSYGAHQAVLQVNLPGVATRVPSERLCSGKICSATPACLGNATGHKSDTRATLECRLIVAGLPTERLLQDNKVMSHDSCAW